MLYEDEKAYLEISMGFSEFTRLRKNLRYYFYPNPILVDIFPGKNTKHCASNGIKTIFYPNFV